MDIYLIRHLKTKGNTEGRYIGITDEPLLPGQEEEAADIACRLPDETGRVITSPMKRCVETAELIFRNKKMSDPFFCTEDRLRETYFGLFENKNYEELKENPIYQKWLESDGTLPFPSGESHEAFCMRCREGFAVQTNRLLEDGVEIAAFVIHGGTIMAILQAFAEEKKGFYDWQTENGGIFHATVRKEEWQEGNRVLRGIEKL